MCFVLVVLFLFCVLIMFVNDLETFYMAVFQNQMLFICTTYVNEENHNIVNTSGSYTPNYTKGTYAQSLKHIIGAESQIEKINKYIHSELLRSVDIKTIDDLIEIEAGNVYFLSLLKKAKESKSKIIVL